MKIAVVFGTRPEIIKLSPIIRALEEKAQDFFIIHTNQHYDKNMDEIFLKELSLPEVKYNLRIGSGSHANMTGKMLIEVEHILIEEKPGILIVQGDTNTVLAVSLAATKLHIPIAHVEAGLRSYSKIPEETNRVLTDRISDYLFVPTQTQFEILKNEGIPENKIHVVGNTVVDAALQNIEIAKQNKNTLQELNLESKEYILFTAHREENVDKKEVLASLIEELTILSARHDLKVIFPAHPRTKKNLEKFNIELPENIHLIEPIGYLDMLVLIQNAKIVLTDSGGLQEEACTLKTPCVTLRESTERPETVDIGANIVAGTDPQKISEAFEAMINKPTTWANPFGTGQTGETIVNILVG